MIKENFSDYFGNNSVILIVKCGIRKYYCKMKLKNKRKINITDKFVLYFLMIFIFSGSIISYIILTNASDAIINRTFDQLISFKVVKKRQIETFFQDREKELVLFFDLLNTEGEKIKNDDFSTQIKSFLSHNKYFSNFNLTEFNGIESDLSSNIPILSDYKIPNENNPALIYSKKIKIESKDFIFSIRISSEQIDKIMLENNPYDGVGISGESYIVGSDSLLRSTSRFIPNSILKVKCNSESVKNSFKSDSSSGITNDYRGIKVLSTASKLKISGLNWIILSEIDYEEAIVPIGNMRIRVLFMSIILSFIIFVITYFLANKVTKPLINLTNAAITLQKGSFLSEPIKLNYNDEIGDLTESFNLLNENLKLKDEELTKERIRRYTAEMDAQEAEKERLSRELHDGIGQMFVALKLKLENIDFAKSKYEGQIEEIKLGIDETIDEIRRISNNLMPSVLSSFGLNLAVNTLVKQLNAISKINFTFESDIKEISDKKTTIYLFRIIQESLNNILKHSKAKNAELKLFQNLNNYSLIISDDGIGFNDEQNISGNGLYNIKERVNSLGGKINIETSETNGTLIIINIPH
jgi:signal transduction histidine kinase